MGKLSLSAVFSTLDDAKIGLHDNELRINQNLIKQNELRR